jgi:photosystem II stability/assembly factor-like uncharacterized protein
MRLNYIYIVLALIVSTGFFCACSSQHEASVTKENPNGRLDAWGFTGPGGGGAMFHPTVSPFDPNFVFVSCDMTGSFVTKNGGNSWRMFNLRGVSDFYTFDPLNKNVVYANSIGLFRSADAGETWNIVFPHPSKILGVVSSGDHAEEIIVTPDSIEQHVLAMAIDPADSRKLFAAMQSGNEITFCTSSDHGETWSKEKLLDDGARDIFIVPSSPTDDREIYVTGKSTVTVRKNRTWKVNRGPDNIKKITAFSGGFDKTKNRYVIYAITGKGYFNKEDDDAGIFYTEDGGETWENRQKDLITHNIASAPLPEYRAVATCVNDPKVVYVSYNNLKVSADTTCIGVARSEDYGKTWTLVWKDHITKQQQIPASNMQDGWLNDRFGPSWGENPFSIGVAPNDSKICYATDFGRTIKTVDGGKTWQQLYTTKKENGCTSRGLEVTTSYNITFDPFDTRHCFINETDIGLMESVDGGESWRSATKDNGIPEGWVNSCYWLEFDPQVRGKIYAAMSGTHDLPRPKMWNRRSLKEFTGGIVISEDGGKTWTPVSRDIGESAITYLLLDPQSDVQSRTLYACAFGKGVYKSTDGGRSWIQKNNGLEGNEPFAWRLTLNNHDGSLFLVTARRSSDGSIGTGGDGAIYRSTDGVKTWKRMTLPAGTNGPMSLVADPQNSEILLLSAWGRAAANPITPDTGGGIFRSVDNGKTWTHVLGHDQHIHDITYDEHSRAFYACGFNGSAYRSDDNGQNWQRIKGYNFKWGKRVVPDPNDREKIFIITFGGGVWHGPARGDEHSEEDIITSGLRFQ